MRPLCDRVVSFETVNEPLGDAFRGGGNGVDMLRALFGTWWRTSFSLGFGLPITLELSNISLLKSVVFVGPYPDDKMVAFCDKADSCHVSLIGWRFSLAYL